MFVPVTLIFDL